jgi:protocatechuate 3,4-dioxygenase beta subunit
MFTQAVAPLNAAPPAKLAAFSTRWRGRFSSLVRIREVKMKNDGNIGMDNGPKLLTRRKALGLLGAAGTTLAAGMVMAREKLVTPESACALPTPHHIEGPYYVVENRRRSDLRSDDADGSLKRGVPLRITVRVIGSRAGHCMTMSDAVVDIWHCDAEGVYSDVVDPHYNTTGRNSLRGYQITDTRGEVSFTTIVPGRYEVRATHIHLKVRQRRGFTPADLRETMRIVREANMPPPSGSNKAAPPTLREEFTTQLYIDDAITDAVYRRHPYVGKVANQISNSKDIFFREGGGSRLILPLSPDGVGYAGTYTVVIPLT